ncbi:hypothetical protein CQW23_11714 [Capsicum baccatum]|uniref:Protein kinase domain-containing protein n=1 Tax=Capsicum baccatum TaxID=33114 RepID=A0A2G2WQJ1_CAPBA|nr:hypothetical protein CQW23_11714 [Capsicum baccatum]
MKVFILLIPIWVFVTPVLSAPVDVTPQPPNADPALPTEKGPIFQVYSDKDAPSPGVAELKVVHRQDLNKKILISLIVASTLLAGILLFSCCFWIYRLKTLKKSTEQGHQKAEPVKGLSWGPIMAKFPSLKAVGRKGLVDVIEYQLLVAATDNFNEKNAIGEGRVGYVYKAQFNDNVQAAVKRIRGGEQDAEKEFENEVDLLSKFQHQNVISLLGYCIHNNAQFLVYEMMQNGSLEFQLHGPPRGSALGWHLRMKIALDVARGLEYLHERCNPPVIHRDLKSSNVLLDSNFSAKLSDFGLAIAGWNLTKSNVKLSGTLGYVAPEYLLDGKLTDKSDVYAFGIILLELLLGRRPVERLEGGQCQSIVTWAMPQLTDRSKLPNIVDPVIRDGMDLKHLYQVRESGSFVKLLLPFFYFNLQNQHGWVI